MKKLLAASLLAASFATPALSADMAVKAPLKVVSAAYDWSGFYFGFTGGGEWGRDHYNEYNANFAESTHFSRGEWGFIGGAQKQFGVVVLGVEGAWNNNIVNINTIPPAPFPANTGISQSISDIATLGARVGYAGWTNWLLYATGGGAWARLDTNFFNATTGAPALNMQGLSSTFTTSGWYAGVGVDYMVYKGTLGDIIVGAEYQHIDFSTAHDAIFYPNPATNTNNYTQDATIDLVRARLTFKFNPFGPAAVVAKY